MMAVETLTYTLLCGVDACVITGIHINQTMISVQMFHDVHTATITEHSYSYYSNSSRYLSRSSLEKLDQT